MTPRTVTSLDVQDQEAVAALRAHGYRVNDIQSLAHDQRPFARRARALHRTIAPGLQLRSSSVDLGGGCFTNIYTLKADLDRVHVEAVSCAAGFHLRDLVTATTGLAAISGSFSFISDDPSYQPAEPCLDLCCRGGEVMSLPTATKPALLVRSGQPVIDTMDATGTLALQNRLYQWAGSKTARPGADHRPGALTVFGAANCRILYSGHPRTGFLRRVDPDSNLTPLDSAAIDYVVAPSSGAGHRVVAVRTGGGTDLFAGNFVLRARRPWARRVPCGTPVQIRQIAGRDVREIQSGISLGPSVADAAAGHTPGYDACLGLSPFRDARHARTLVGLRGRTLVLQVLDGAPKSDTFRGTTPQETATLCQAAGLDPHGMYHLDGGASSKIAYRDRAVTRALGSLHYLKWPTTPSEPFRWQGLDGRTLRSALVLKANHHEEHP
ncbi:phosphodiester glycosidase family protein [Streptomyces sp. NPDC059003]|uniref:phosphodiester glycosidase family protein n=1 Tax=Streptomyces sp. NPDC059003 TaxID=3346691 RepID=UPI00369C3D2B